MKSKKLLRPTLIFLALFVCTLLVDFLQESRQNAHVAALQQQARPYERELEELRRRLQPGYNAREKASFSSLTVAFVPGTGEDVAAIEELMAPLGRTPLVILDCSLEWETLEQITSAALARGFGLVCSGMTMDEGVLAQAAKLAPLLPQESQDTFFLRGNWDTPANMAALTQAGFDRFIRYDENLQSGLDENRCPRLVYSFIQSPSDTVLLLTQAASLWTHMLLCIHFEDIQNGTTPLPVVESVLTVVQQSLATGSLRYAAMEQSFQALLEQEREQRLAIEERERQQQESEERMEELISIIRSIYSHRYDLGGA